jgi:hypothetical protein
VAETIVLDPAEEAEGRVEFDITSFIGRDGVDWGDAAIEAHMAKLHMGAIPVDHDVPPRAITIALALKDRGAVDFETARERFQAKAARFQQEGGWLKRVTRAGRTVFADVTSATLKLGGGWGQAHRGYDTDAVLTLEALPDFYEAEEQLDDIVETTQAELVSLLKKDGLPAVIRGDYPARCRIVVDEDDGERQLGLLLALRSRHYSDAPTAALAYEAEHLTPRDAAAIATLSGASGEAANNVVQHADLSTNWTAVLATDLLPAVRSVGAAASGTGNVQPGAPAGSKDKDIWLLFVETANEAVPVPAGYAHVPDSPVSVAAGGVTRLSLLWKRVADGETAPTITDPGDHCVAQLVAVKNCIETGDPWDVTAAATEAVVDTSASIPGDTTTVDGCLVLAAVATGADVASTAQASAFVNADLQALTERLDNWVIDGNGGGFAMASGVKPRAGAYAATTCTLATAAEKAMLSIALKPKAGGNALTHTGTYRVRARAHSPNGQAVQLRLVWDVGDLTNPVENAPVRLPATASNFFDVDLGEIRLDRPLIGAHRWQGMIQAKGDAGGEDVSIDKVRIVPVDEGHAVMRAPMNVGPDLSGFAARDEFNQSVGVLAGKTLPAGGTWSGAGDADDFSVETAGKTAQRTAVSDVADTGRQAIAGTTVLAATAVQVDTKAGAVSNGQSAARGAIARWVDANNFLEAVLTTDSFFGTSIGVRKRIGGTFSTLQAAGGLFSVLPNGQFFGLNEWVTIKLAVLGDRYFVWLYRQGAATPVVPVLAGQDADLAGTLDDGRVGMIDRWEGAQALTRNYDNFAAWVPQPDAVLHPNQSAELATDGMSREDASGVSGGPVSHVVGDLPRLPVSGLEERPVELFLKWSRGDFDQLPDSGIDDGSAQVFYRASWLFVPGA